MWTILVSRLNDPPGSFFDRRQIDAGQIKVGRSEKSCDLVLPDEQGFVSREHCTISAIGLDLFVTDISKNGVALNDPAARIVPGQPVSIRPGDRLVINDFVITVSTPADAAGVSLAAPPPPPLPMGGGTAGDDIWGAGPVDPFLGDLGGNETHDFLSGGGGGFSPPPLSPDFGAPPPPIGDFGFGEPFGQAYAPRPIMADPNPFAGSIGIPEDWANPGNGVGDGLPIPEFEPFPAAPAPSAFDGEPPFGAPAFDPFAASAPSGFAAPDAAAPSATPAPAPSAGGADWAAFYEGAGFSPDDLKLPSDAMYRLGVLYRQVVLGLCDILQDRATFKDEFRVERTQLSVGRNNPLKHLAAFDAAKVVIGQPLPGFMDGEEAVRTSFEDIKKHQMAMLAGVQNALTTAFSRLSPQEMEKLVEKAQGEKKGFLGKRGIDRWSLYVTVYENLRRDATSNANGIMSAAFREGYEQFMKSAR
ncbi:FHA domain protein [Novosphingobium sp. CF614]|uniref:type VI secretion system-associated FHA domain protein TagH n=1 Tax=Novosphingobium sp. CF614 TaxID=1884364 RepID=UPI0008F0E110|nr:type VI secretion system-associated FHA domain protein TagH [Novosphingobium sp. CF614]SFF95097.1 FHA domain protein [Novosphingobium sp. CF614]